MDSLSPLLAVFGILAFMSASSYSSPVGTFSSRTKRINSDACLPIHHSFVCNNDPDMTRGVNVTWEINGEFFPGGSAVSNENLHITEDGTLTMWRPWYHLNSEGNQPPTMFAPPLQIPSHAQQSPLPPSLPPPPNDCDDAMEVSCFVEMQNLMKQSWQICLRKNTCIENGKCEHEMAPEIVETSWGKDSIESSQVSIAYRCPRRFDCAIRLRPTTINSVQISSEMQCDDPCRGCLHNKTFKIQKIPMKKLKMSYVLQVGSEMENHYGASRSFGGGQRIKWINVYWKDEEKLFSSYDEDVLLPDAFKPWVYDKEESHHGATRPLVNDKEESPMAITIVGTVVGVLILAVVVLSIAVLMYRRALSLNLNKNAAREEYCDQEKQTKSAPVDGTAFNFDDLSLEREAFLNHHMKETGKSDTSSSDFPDSTSLNEFTDASPLTPPNSPLMESQISAEKYSYNNGEDRRRILSILMAPGSYATGSANSPLEATSDSLAELQRKGYFCCKPSEKPVDFDASLRAGTILQFGNQEKCLFIKTRKMVNTFDELWSLNDRVRKLVDEIYTENAEQVMLEVEKGRMPDQLILNFVHDAFELTDELEFVTINIVSHYKFMGLLYPIPVSCIHLTLKESWFQLPHNSKLEFQSEEWNLTGDTTTNQCQFGLWYLTNSKVPATFLYLMSLSINKMCHNATRKVWKDGIIASNGIASIYLQKYDAETENSGAYDVKDHKSGFLMICQGPESQKQMAIGSLLSIQSDANSYFTLWPKLEHRLCPVHFEEVNIIKIDNEMKIKPEVLLQKLIPTTTNDPEYLVRDKPSSKKYDGCFAGNDSKSAAGENQMSESGYGTILEGVFARVFKPSDSSGQSFHFVPYSREPMDATATVTNENHATTNFQVLKQYTSAIGIHVNGIFEQIGSGTVMKVSSDGSAMHIMTCLHVIELIMGELNIKVPASSAEIHGYNQFFEKNEILVVTNNCPTNGGNRILRVISPQIGDVNSTDHILLEAVCPKPPPYDAEHLVCHSLKDRIESFMYNLTVIGYVHNHCVHDATATYNRSFTKTCILKLKNELENLALSYETKACVHQNLEELAHQLFHDQHVESDEDSIRYHNLMSKLDLKDELVMLTDPKKMLMNCKLRNGTSGGPIFVTEIGNYLSFPNLPSPTPFLLVGIYSRGFPKSEQKTNRNFEITQGTRIWCIYNAD